MSNHPDSLKATAALSLPSVPDTDAAVPAERPPSGALDAHGHDPADYQWLPVRRRKRADGFSEYRQRQFIEALADTGVVETAANQIGISPQSCYRLRRSPGAERFAAAWDAAIEQASRKLVDLAFERAIHGSDEPVFDREGRPVGRRMRHNDRLMMFLLRAYMPDRFRHAHQNNRHPSEPPPPATVPLAEAIAQLEPAPPPEPHRLMSPDDLDTALLCADILPGQLPHWHRDPLERPISFMPYGQQEGEPPISASPLGEDFDRQLDDAKRGVWTPDGADRSLD